MTARDGSGAGYSGTPLLKKLGVEDGSTLVLVGEPPGVIGEIPANVTLRRQARGAADVVVAFFTKRSELERRISALSRMVYPDGGLWVAWPKRTSGLDTTVTDHAVRELALPLGLVDNKVCAIDATWTGTRVVWRRERRG